jgi:methyl-accepting chemotaxis protein
MNKPTNRRKLRNLWIRKDIQLWLVATNALLMFFIVAAVLLSVLVPLYDGFQLSDDYRVQHFAAKFFIIILDRLLPTVLSVFALASIFAIVTTHRICGPLVNLSRTFERIAAGDFTRRVHLRRGDFLKREAAMVNTMNAALSARFKTIQNRHRTLRDKLDELRRLEPASDAADKALDDLAQALDACIQASDELKTGPGSDGAVTEDYRP